MLTFIDVIYLIFAVVTLYFSILLLYLYFEHRKKLRTQEPIKELPPASIIIPAYNEEKTIGATIQAVLAMDYPKDKLKVIVVDHSSKDKTFEEARKFSDILVVKKIREGVERKAHALNYGLKFANTELVACVDADSYPEPEALKNAVMHMTSPDIAAVTSSIFVKNPRNFVEKLQHLEYALIVWSRKLLEFVDGVYVTPGPLSVYRKEVLQKVGGFDENNLTEDIEIAWRLLYNGYKIKMSLNSIVYTSAPTSFKVWWKQRDRWNQGGIQTMIKYSHAFFRKKFGSLGMFVVPFFFFSYLFSIVGLGVFLYIITKSFLDFSYLMIRAYQLGISLPSTQFFDYIFIPNIFTIFGALTFLLSLVWIKISLVSTKKKLGGFKGLLELAFYLTLYITLFPFILIYSTFKYFTGKERAW